MELPVFIAELLIGLVHETALIALSCVCKSFYLYGRERFKLMRVHRQDDLRHLYFQRELGHFRIYTQRGYMHCAIASFENFKHLIYDEQSSYYLLIDTFRYNDVELSSWCINALQIDIDRFNPYHLDNLDNDCTMEYLQWLLKTMPQHKVHLIHKAIDIHKFDILVDKEIDLIYYIDTIFQLSVDEIDELCCVTGAGRLACSVSYEKFAYLCHRGETDICKFLLYISNENSGDIQHMIMNYGDKKFREWYNWNNELNFPKYKYVRDPDKQYPFYLCINRYST